MKKGIPELTRERLRTYKKFESLTDEEADKVIYSIQDYVHLVISIYLKNKKEKKMI